MDAYLSCARRFAAFHMRSPEELGEEQVRAFLRHLHVDLGLGPSSLKMHTAALRFLYGVTLDRPEVTARLPYPRIPPVRVEVLAPEDVQSLLAATEAPLYRTLFATTYGAGLRVGEVVLLHMVDVDGGRGLLFEVASSVLQDLAADRMDARLGITAVLHTWSRDLGLHPHLHCIVTAGGLRRDDKAWVEPSGTRFPVRILRRLVRGRFLARLQAVVDEYGLDPEEGKAFATLRRALYRKRWVVHTEPPADRPVGHLVKYLARYVYGVAISDERLVSDANGEVTFRTRGQRTVTMEGPEFVRRFLQHVLPARFVKVRHYGLYAPVNVARRLHIAHRLLSEHDLHPVEQSDESEPIERAEEQALCVPTCPVCGPAVDNAWSGPCSLSIMGSGGGPPLPEMRQIRSSGSRGRCRPWRTVSTEMRCSGSTTL